MLDAAARTADQARTRIDEVLAGVGEDVLARYDEYRLDVEIDGDDLGVDRVDLGGEIDHLAVTDDTYHVFDYKTDRAGSDDADALVEARMTHHEPQMLAYAAALRAADPTRNVVVQLVFTDLDCHVARMDETDDAIDRLVDMLTRTSETIRKSEISQRNPGDVAGSAARIPTTIGSTSTIHHPRLK
ncbi:PD-(D/E)XK nuclease family protein [Halobaculum litoreum]|uniref:PD-(D/E)XK nuclease family protein n=1 Tax=Halobaculum litoreum TaxID=3031998 RepID=A0ABD5XRD1_9EURY